jgi:hypothetical protein
MTPTWYTATCVGEYVEGSANLLPLVELVRLIRRPDGRDTCIHDQTGRLVAVVHSNGRAELLPATMPGWGCIHCGAPIPHGMACCDLCHAERQHGAPGVELGCPKCGGKPAA